MQEGRQNEKKRNKGDAAADWIGQAVDRMDDSGNFDGTGRASVCFRDYGSGRICVLELLQVRVGIGLALFLSV